MLVIVPAMRTNRIGSLKGPFMMHPLLNLKQEQEACGCFKMTGFLWLKVSGYPA